MSPGHWVLILTRHIQRFNNQANHRKLSLLTAFWGFVLLVDAVIHIVMALTLSTVTFLAMSKGATWVGILAIVLGGKWLARRSLLD